MDIEDELVCLCTNENAREIEFWLRSELYRWKYIQADMVVEPFYRVLKAYDDTGLGFSVSEDVAVTDENNNIISHFYKDQLDTDEQVNKLCFPTITARPDIDEKRIDFAKDMLGNTLDVRLTGFLSYHAPWDFIARLRGVQPILFDMIDRPEFIHKIRKFFLDAGLNTYLQMENQGLLDYNVAHLHCTPPYSKDLPAEDFDGTLVRMKDIWFRGMAQMFSTVSPSMFKEFDLDYMLPIMEKFGLSYYGCCEPLDNFLDMLMCVPNMRKLGVSSWANVDICAEKMGSNYVFSHKPNPAIVIGIFNEEALKEETIRTVEACLKWGCPYEIILKDISSVSYKPQNLINWVKNSRKCS
jgi:hypothetical protein